MPRPKGTLQIKILSGYLLLTLLVGGIVYAVWNEKQVFQEAEEEERAMLEQRRLTNSAFKSLIALLLYSDGALLWDKDDLRSYEENDYITLNVPPGAFSNVPLQTWSLSVRQS